MSVKLNSFCIIKKRAAVLRLFQRTRYSLTKVKGYWEDGMVVAILEEYFNMESFQTYLDNRVLKVIICYRKPDKYWKM